MIHINIDQVVRRLSIQDEKKVGECQLINVFSQIKLFTDLESFGFLNVAKLIFFLFFFWPFFFILFHFSSTLLKERGIKYHAEEGDFNLECHK